MTVSASQAYSGPLLANASTVAFPFTFPCQQASDVAVQVAGAQVTTGFTVTLNADQVANPGGTVTFSTAPGSSASPSNLYVYSDPDFGQDAAFEAGVPWIAQSVLTQNGTNDRAALRDQALKRDLLRTVRMLPIGETGAVMPVAASRAGMFDGYDASGLPTVLSGTGADSALRTDLAASGGGALIKIDDGASGTNFTTAQGFANYALPYLPQLTPSASLDQSAIIQAAFNSYAALGVRLKLKPGTYICTNISIPNGLQLDCEGQSSPYGTYFVHTTGATTPHFIAQATPTQFVSFGGASFTGNGLSGEIGILLQATASSSSPYNGGTWNWYLHDIYMSGYGGKAIWSRGGNVRVSGGGSYNYETPNQFLHFARVHIDRPATATSRCISLTGQHGQITFDGECYFDSVGYNTAGSRAGCNICISREWTNGTLYGDLFDAVTESTGTYPGAYNQATFTTNSGWAVVDNIAPLGINFASATVQSSRYGIVVDALSTVTIERGWFENLDRSITVIGGGSFVRAHNIHFANAAGSSSQGWNLKAESTGVIFHSGNDSNGGDAIEVTYNGSIINGGGNVAPAGEGTSYNALQQVSISSGAISIGANTAVYVAGGAVSSPTSLNTINSDLWFGQFITVTVFSGYVQLAAGGNIYCSGAGNNGGPVYGPGDTFIAMRGDTLGQWIVVDQTNPEGLPGITVNGDGNIGCTPWGNTITQYFNTPLTANRTVTFGTAVKGNKFRIVRSSAATGAFTLTLTGPGTTVAIGAWVEIQYDGSAWRVIAAGTGV